MRGSVLFGILLPFFVVAQSANTVVGVDLDTTIIRIGEQVQLHLRVSGPPGATDIQWPIVTDTLSAQLEVISDSGVDTLPNEGAFQQYVRSLTLTSFDTGFWAIPPFHFVVAGKPMDSQALLLEVRSVELDSVTMRDIKDIHTLPFSTWYWVRQHKVWFFGGAAILTALVVLLYLYRKRKAPVVSTPAAPNVPLHDRILGALDTLNKERLWQQGEHKSYHSRITDLLRGYIEERYKVPALESTTDELIRELRVSPLNTDQRSQLENMLRLADMVKFAKATPSPEENEQMMVGAVRFVRETRSAETNDHG